MTEVNSEAGTITDDVAVDMLLGEPEGANPDEDGQAAQDAEVVEHETEGDEPDAEEAAPAEDAENPEPAPADAQTFTVTIDGKPVSVTQDELTSGYMRQQDYTRKTQEIAQQRGVITQAAQALAAALQGASVTQEAEPNWPELAATLDPKDYQQERAKWEANQGKNQQAREVLRQIQAQERQTMLESEKAKLLERIPEWADPATATAEFATIVEAAGKYGFTPAEVEANADHRLILMARELAKMQAANAALATRKQVIPPVTARPSGRAAGEADRNRQKAREAFDKNPTDDNAVRLLLGG